MTILNVLRLLLVSLWLGAAVFFSSVVAPSVFSVLRAFQVPNVGEIAGDFDYDALPIAAPSPL